MKISPYYYTHIKGPFEVKPTGSLEYFLDYVNSQFIEKKFNSSFEELKLEFYYTEMNKLIKKVNLKIFPTTNMYRQHKKIVVKLYVPELAEHFIQENYERPEIAMMRHILQQKSKDELNNMRDSIDMILDFERSRQLDENPEKKSESKQGNVGVDLNLSEPEISNSIEPSKKYNNVDLAKIFIDKFIEAGRLVAKKIKTGDRFNFEHYENILLKIKESISDDFFSEMNNEQKSKRRCECLNLALNTRRYRKRNRKINRTEGKLINLFGIWTFGIESVKGEYPAEDCKRVLGGKLLVYRYPPGVLEPYAYRIGKVFLKVLRRKKVLSVNYGRFPVIASTTKEDALIGTVWAPIGSCGIATFDYEKYKTLTEKEKSQVVFDIYCQGLRDGVEVEGFDSNTIEEVIKEVGAVVVSIT